MWLAVDEELRVYTDSAPTTNDLVYKSLSRRLFDGNRMSSGAVVAKRGTIDDTTTTAVVDSYDSGPQVVEALSIWNADTVSATINFETWETTGVVFYKLTLASLYLATWTKDGWKVITSAGVPV